MKIAAVPSESAWRSGSAWSWALVLVGIPALAASVLLAVGYPLTLRRVEKTNDLNRVCVAVARLVDDKTSASWDNVGAHVWALRGRKGFRYLERRASHQPSTYRETAITWRKGKGAIGLCWAKNRPFVADVEALESIAPDREAFVELQGETRYGLTWDEFEETRHYRAVLVVPIRGGRPGRYKLRGVLSIDLQEGGKAAELERLLRDADFTNLLRVCDAAFGLKASRDEITG